MIENNSFSLLSANKELQAAATKRGMTIATCGNAIVLYNRYYGFFFMDIINDERLDAWVVDSQKIKQTYSMTDLIWKYYNAATSKKIYGDFLSSILDDSNEAKVSGKGKLAELIFYAALIADKFDGVETGGLPLAEESLHPITEVNWQKWSSCMA